MGICVRGIAPSFCNRANRCPGLAAEKVRRDMAALNDKALAGDTQAQLQLGIAFEFGQGVDKNLDEAMH